MSYTWACPGSRIQLQASKHAAVSWHSAPVLRHRASQHRPQPQLRSALIFPGLHRGNHRQPTCSARSSSVELPPQDYVAPAGKIESTRLDSQLRRKVEDAVEALGRRVTIGDVSSRAGVSLSEAEEALNALAADSAGSLEVSSAGEVLYTLPNNFKAIIRGRSWLLRTQPAFRAASNLAGYLVRVAFGAALIASVTLVWTTILAVMSSSSNSSDDRNRQRGGGGGGTMIYMNSYMFRDLSNLFWYGSPRYDRMQQRRGQRKEMGFLESIFSFVFGDGNPNLDFEERRWKMVGELISRNGGVVTAEQLAPYLDPPAGLSEGALQEDFVVPALVRFGGSPSVDAAGQLLYTFPSLQSLGGAGRGRREKLEVAAVERPWKLSKAQGSQKWGGAALGIANLVGVLVLQGLLASRSVQATQYAELATALSGPLFLLKVYALSFFLIPALRWVSNVAKNRVIEARNDSRAAAAKALRSPSPTLQRKLDRARAQAQQKVVRNDEIIYNSDRGSEGQDDDGADFDRRLNGQQDSAERLSDARLVWDQKQQQQQRRDW